jgi:hypothetical protein
MAFIECLIEKFFTPGYRAAYHGSKRKFVYRGGGSGTWIKKKPANGN